MPTEQLASWIDSELKKIIDAPEQLAAERNLLLNYVERHQDEASLLDRILKQRIKERVPLAYILGETRFYGLTFYVSATDRGGIDTEGSEKAYHTYSPRLETEMLVDAALNFCRQNKVRRIVDVATGSGCIPISVKKNYPDATVTAIDLSADALAVAQRNAKKNDVDIHFLQGSWLEPVQNEKFDLVLCNPPYAPRDQKAALTPEANHEPEQALYPEETPIGLYQLLLKQTKQCLESDGAFMFEIGFGQFPEAFDIVAYSREVGLNAHLEKDHTGIDRFLIGRHAS